MDSARSGGSGWLDEMDRESPDNATWADVALALVEFAREDTWKFILVVGILMFLWWELRFRIIRTLVRDYIRRRGAEAPEPPPVESESDD